MPVQLVPALLGCMAALCSCSGSLQSQAEPSPGACAVPPDVAGPEWEVLQAAASLLCTLSAGHPQACKQVGQLNQ